MIEPSRRGFLTGLGAALVGLAAPAVIRTPGLLMPVKAEALSDLSLDCSLERLLIPTGNRLLTLHEITAEAIKRWKADLAFYAADQWPREFARVYP